MWDLRPGGLLDILDGRVATQRDLDQLEIEASRNSRVHQRQIKSPAIWDGINSWNITACQLGRCAAEKGCAALVDKTPLQQWKLTAYYVSRSQQVNYSFLFDTSRPYICYYGQCRPLLYKREIDKLREVRQLTAKMIRAGAYDAGGKDDRIGVIQVGEEKIKEI